LSESTGGRPLKQYALTIDAAKEISMIQRTKKGKEALEYFMQCEKELKIPQLLQNYIGALEALVVSEEEKIQLQKQITIQSSKIEFIDRIASRSYLILPS
jgi:anti-repressor protein